MKQLTPEQKHSILLEYSPRSPTHSFSALAARHGLGNAKSTVKSWYDRWDGTIESLQHKKGAGRPCALSAAQVARYILRPIRRANQQHRVIHYPQLLPPLNSILRRKIALRTLRKYGKQQAGIKKKRSTLRTPYECQFTTTPH